jgi:outer membrane protein assembly factor BamD (BamD/ComL family)
MNLLRGLCFLTAAVFIVACSSAESDWNQANQTHTVAAYQDFLNKHPDSPHAADAKTQIQTLQDNQAWATAQQTNTADGYQQYLTAEPNGAHAQEAQQKLTALKATDAWNSTKNNPTEASLNSFLQMYPNTPEADQARSMLQTLDYRVELGSYRSADAADKAKTQLQDKFGKELQEVQVIQPTGKSKVFHLASAAMTQDQAKAACAQVKKGGQRCEVVKKEPASS